MKLVPFILVNKIYIIKLLLHATHKQTPVTSFNFVTNLRYAIIQLIFLRWIPYRIYQALVRVSCDTPELWRLWRAPKSNYSVYDPVYSWIVRFAVLCRWAADILNTYFQLTILGQWGLNFRWCLLEILGILVGLFGSFEGAGVANAYNPILRGKIINLPAHYPSKFKYLVFKLSSLILPQRNFANICVDSRLFVADLRFSGDILPGQFVPSLLWCHLIRFNQI